MIRIATRGSRLALWQANFVQNELIKLGVDAELNIIKTKGDKIQDLSFDKIEGKGFFTKEIEESLIMNESDIAIHSLKDLPTENHPTLALVGVSNRANPFDCILMHKTDDQIMGSLENLKAGMTVGTSSARRKVQIKNLNPSITTKDIRGNVPTRIDKLRQKDFDAIILAKAGIDRLQLDVSDLQMIQLTDDHMIPAPAQGVLGYQCRYDDKAVQDLIQKLNHQKTHELAAIERKALHLIDGGCQTPFGAYCKVDQQDHYILKIAFARDEHSELHHVEIRQKNPNYLAENAIQKLKECI